MSRSAATDAADDQAAQTEGEGGDPDDARDPDEDVRSRHRYSFRAGQRCPAPPVREAVNEAGEAPSVREAVAEKDQRVVGDSSAQIADLGPA